MKVNYLIYINEIKTFILDLDNKDKEINQNSANVKPFFSEINNLIDNFLKKKELPECEKEALEALKQSYSSNIKLSEKEMKLNQKKFNGREFKGKIFRI